MRHPGKCLVNTLQKGPGVYCAAVRPASLWGAALKNKLALVFTLALGFLSVPRLGFAHRAAAAFDPEHSVTKKGTVTVFEWSNPHALIYLDVKDAKGNVER